jgi:hypothetical protein
MQLLDTGIGPMALLAIELQSAAMAKRKHVTQQALCRKWANSSHSVASFF